MNQHATIEQVAEKSGAATDASTRPALSICIPTFERARYLERLLARLREETAEFGDAVEIIVSDNASTDDTAAVCAAAGLGDRLRYFRQDENIGALRNIWFTWSRARGKYALYLADDDMLLWPGVIRAINLLELNPEAVALYAPWRMLDLETGADHGTFYHHEGVRSFSHVERAEFARFILTHQVFSEISIFRTDLMRRIAPATDGMAFWAFTIPSELLSFGDLIYSDTPFYGFVTRHAGLPDRSQGGAEEVMVGWDRYRGGLEHMIGLAEPLTDRQRAEMRTLADRMIEDRMIVALRLRLATRKDPIETYFLASRLRGLGRAADLPVEMNAIRLRAGIAFLDDHIVRRTGAERLALAGYDDSVAAWMAGVSRIPVARLAPGEAATARDIVLAAGEGGGVALDAIRDAAFFITESDLLAKYR